MNRFSALMMGLAVLIGVVVWMSFGTSEDDGNVNQSLTTGEYMSVVNWPPQVQMIDTQYSCEEGDAEAREETINNRKYCVTTVEEAAAGGLYTQHTYTTDMNGRTLLLTFSTRLNHCANLEPEKRLACEAEQKAFDPRPYIDDLVSKQSSVGTQNIGEATNREAILSGTYICLPHTNTTGPQTLECALGLHASDGSYYALDFNQNPEAQFTLKTGDRISVEGIITPVEMLSSDAWMKYSIKGIFTITGEVKKI